MRWVAIYLALVGAVASAVTRLPVVPPAAIEQLQHVIGSRVEAATILGGIGGFGAGPTGSNTTC